jgi:hypothetical protein
LSKELTHKLVRWQPGFCKRFKGADINQNLHVRDDGAPRRSAILFLLVSFSIFPSATLNNDFARPLQASPASQAIARAKIAEGEYEVYEQANLGAVGPFGEEIYNFRESWTLWRAEKGEYEVEGERHFESPRDTLHDDRFVLRLSRDLTLLSVKEFAKLKWRPDSGPLTCEFLPRELHCSSGARDPSQLIELRIPMQHPYGFLWPISAFSLSSITRAAERDPGRPTRVQLVTVEEPSKEDPVYLMTLDGELRYLGKEDLQAAGQKWPAYKFSLKVPLHSSFMIWTSSKGIVLALAAEHPHQNWREEGMRLVKFQKWADF